MKVREVLKLLKDDGWDIVVTRAAATDSSNMRPRKAG
jgi:hypothetical protein